MGEFLGPEAHVFGSPGAWLSRIEQGREDGGCAVNACVVRATALIRIKSRIWEQPHDPLRHASMPQKGHAVSRQYGIDPGYRLDRAGFISR